MSDKRQHDEYAELFNDFSVLDESSRPNGFSGFSRDRGGITFGDVYWAVFLGGLSVYAVIGLAELLFVYFAARVILS